MTWTTVVLVIPADKRDIGNRIAHIFDPDVGGADTFTVGYSEDRYAPATHYVACTPIEADYLPALEDAAVFYGAMKQLAAARNRVIDFNLQDVSDLMAVMVINDTQGMLPVQIGDILS